MTDVLNHRVGPHPGCPFKCLAAPIYRVGLHPGRPLCMPDALNSRVGPQAREPSKCPNGGSYRGRLAKEAFWSPATGDLRRNSARAYSCGRGCLCPCTLGATRVPASQAAVPPSPSTLTGAQLPQVKAVLCRVTSVLSRSLRPCGLWLLCQGGASPGKNIGAFWPILVAMPF